MFEGIYEPIKGDMESLEDLLTSRLKGAEKSLQELVLHANRFRGKRIRPALLLGSANACGHIGPHHIVLSAVVELIHNATLIHDDVIDEAQTRRQVDTFNFKWGDDTAVVFGDYLLAQAFTLCAELGDQRSTSILALAARNMCMGELWQIKKKFHFHMNEQEYIEIIQLKTASLFSASTLLGAIGSKEEQGWAGAFEQFGLYLGTAFQIVDDCIDIVGDEDRIGKSLGRDLMHGKITLPLIKVFGMLSSKRRSELEMVLRSQDDWPQRRLYIKGLLEQYGAIDYALKKAGEYIELAKVQLRGFNDSIYTRLLYSLADCVGARV
jgi:octaprenyl-diphosphate synthase